MPGQVTGGTQGHFLTVAIFRSWRGLAGSAAPGLPGHGKHTRDGRRCQSRTHVPAKNLYRSNALNLQSIDKQTEASGICWPSSSGASCHCDAAPTRARSVCPTMRSTLEGSNLALFTWRRRIVFPLLKAERMYKILPDADHLSGHYSIYQSY